MNETQTVEIPLSDFDVQLIPPVARQPGTEAFRNAVSAFIESEFQGFAGWAQIVVNTRTIRVTWRSKPNAPDPLDEAIKRLNRGDYGKGVQLLRLILPVRKRDAAVYFNLGMALSDLGELDEAEDHLREAIEIAPDMVHARVALGVALARKRKLEEAASVLEEAVEQNSDDPYALRNLAACLLGLKRDLPRAETMVRKATDLIPNDQQAWIGLAQILEAQAKLEEADKAYIKTIEVSPHNQIAEAAKQARSRFAEKSFRTAAGGVPRMDAVMYCLAALQKFDQMNPRDVQKVGVEIATLGMRGINPSDPNVKYRLRALPGEFTGLALLCYEFVAFKKIDPKLDIGFDVAQEYQAALQLHGKK